MAVELGRAPLTASRASVPLWSRIYGFGSIYAKTIRDSRLAFIIMAGLLGAILFAGGAAFGSTYHTAEARRELDSLVATLPPVLKGLYGNPVNVETLGGSLWWKYGPWSALFAGLWSILALSATLGAEVRQGSLEFVASAPLGRRRIAVEKLAAHLTVVVGVMAILALATWATGALFGSLPGDAIPPSAAIGFAIWVGLMGLAFGSVAFALAPFVGRAPAAAAAGALMAAGYLLNGYRSTVPAFSGAADLTPFGWTAGHLPLAGLYDWGSLVPVALLAAVLLAGGIEAFARRDLGVTAAIRTPRLPAATCGLRGPLDRAFGELLPAALAWGLGIGIYGLVVAAASRSFADEMRRSPDTLNTFRAVFPGYDFASAGGFLQLVFVQLGFIVAGFAAATLVAGWASDETAGRLEMLLATPLARARWAVLSGIGAFAAVGVVTVLAALGVAIGAASAGSDLATPILGTVALGLYALAVAGIGVAVGGIVRSSIAAEVAATVVVATFLVDLLAPALNLPAWVRQLALTAHFGQPMIGRWDAAGVVVSLVIAAVALALGGWGMTRRDIAR